MPSVYRRVPVPTLSSNSDIYKLTKWTVINLCNITSCKSVNIVYNHNCQKELTTTEKSNKRTAEKAERKKENDHYRNERVPLGRAERREEQDAHEQRKSLLLHTHDL